ncbi:MAG TPA: hypothetical protein VLY83_00905 [Methanoregula sp.]|nr:hypothetical protein [Methanoregula sp.]
MRTSSVSAMWCAVIGISLVISLVTIAADAQTAGSLTRGRAFSVTITGQPNTIYFVWDAGTFPMSGAPGDQPPIIAGGTFNLQKDPPGGPYVIGMHTISTGGTILDDVAPSNDGFSNTDYYAEITTDANGQGTVEFRTSSNTAAQNFRIKVEDQGGNPGQLQVTASLPPTLPSPAATPAPFVTAIPLPQPTITIVPPAALPTTTITPAAPATAGTTAPAPSATLTPPSPVPVGIGILAVLAGLALAARR